MITSKKTPEGKVVQTLELRGYESLELWRAVFAHKSELETFLKNNKNLPKQSLDNVQSRIDGYTSLLARLDRLSNQVD